MPAAQATSLTAIGQPVVLLRLDGETPSTQMVTLAFMASPVILDSAPQLPRAGGPLLGIVEWSGGGGGGQIEFDVPCNRAGGTLAGGPFTLGVTPGGGAMVSVPASHVKAYARNDAGLIIGTVNGASPLGNTALIPQVSAFCGYGPKTGKLTRTVWVWHQNAGFGVPALTVGFINVPPFARSFTLLRNQTVAADFIDVTLMGTDQIVGQHILETVPVVGTAPSPVIQVGPTNIIRLIARGGNAGTIENCCVVFELEN